MESNILVTGYTNPDLDATACAVAYAEYLRATGQPATAGIFGKPHVEAEFVLSFFHTPHPQNATERIAEHPPVVLVDASDLSGISAELKPDQVIEIIDHRQVHQADQFPNAKAQIELVGSAATLVAEKFFTNQIDISRAAAALLYSAIISNTVNFQANVTTDRDKKMAQWLTTKVKLPHDYIHQMFTAKSQLAEPLKEVILSDLVQATFAGYSIGIAQLEITGVAELIASRRQEIIEALRDLKTHRQLSYLFLTAIDLERATNTFVVADDVTQKLLEDVLGVVFHDRVATKEGIMMRKTIIPLIKEYLYNPRS